MFHHKLNFLMELADITNSSLAKTCNLDSSYISKLRNGKRKLPKQQNFLGQLTNYISHKLDEAYQFEYLAQALGSSFDVYDLDGLNQKLEAWLIDDAITGPLCLSSEESKASLKDRVEPSFYYGIAGKRQAVIRFLTEVANHDQALKLLFFSNEVLDWLFTDPGFEVHWEDLMKKVLARGHHIQIIHNMDVNYGEMQLSIR